MIPLISHRSASDIVAWRETCPVTAAEYLRDVRLVARALPQSRHILNDCHDRYQFAVTLGAMMISGKISLLPSTRSPETIRQLLKFAPDAVCISDQPASDIDLPVFKFPALKIADTKKIDVPYEVPALAQDLVVAYVFTSGSTGEPKAHRKTWAALVLDVRMEAQQLGLAPEGLYTIVGTVPAQHMYGFESTVLIALVNGYALACSHSFFPADICDSLALVPRPRVLVTTPVHLRSLLGSGLALPPADLLVSATAALAPQLALEAEKTFNVPLLEIYGSTETGQIATRQPTKSPEWTLFPGLQMERRDEHVWISGGHVEMPMPMNDEIEIIDERRFLLHGRLSDLINIAGKRSSLAFLNHHLNAIPGVEDGVFFMPPEAAGAKVTRLEAFVVAPGLTRGQLMSALRERIDAAFLPRPLHMLDKLPRNNTGKLPANELAALSQALRKISGKPRRKLAMTTEE